MNPDIKDHVVETTEKLKRPGLLLVGTKKNGKSNVMTIGWGLIGVFWAKPVFMVAVRPTRHTFEFIEEGGEFTVNVPADGMEDVVLHCGTVSGREHDKFSEYGLTLKDARSIKVPVIEECVIHYECRVVHKLDVKPGLVPRDVDNMHYPLKDYHTLYFGEIVEFY
jgi:flavin reductase (DIM6/NTAB) family NADH-FMN oxidoreductase RutF